MIPKHYLIIGGIIFCIFLVTLVTFKSENFPIGKLPTTNCNVQQLNNISTDIVNAVEPILNTTDQVTTNLYNKALTSYKTTLNDYNNLVSCNPLCVSGTVDTNGICICKDGTPFVHTDGKIYCVPIDLSSVPNTIFDPTQSKFVCKAGFSQTNLANGDNTCYNTANTEAALSYIKQLTDATATINNTVKSVVNAYGKVGRFFISGQAAMPAGTKLFDRRDCLTTAECANNAGFDAASFVYNPQTQICTYYSSSTPLSSLATGSYTVGTTIL